MTSDQPSPGTGGQPLTQDGPLLPDSVITMAGPGTVLSCVTAACTNCDALPADEDTGMTPHFASTGQAAQELAQNWGWHHERRSEWAKDDVLLCPRCAALTVRAAPPRPRTERMPARCSADVFSVLPGRWRGA